MQPQEMVAFFLFAVAAAVTPGPSNLLVMAAGARAGWAGGLRCLAGVVLGMALLMGVAAFGLAGVLQAWPGLLMAFRAGGSLFLLWLAWQIASAPPMQGGRSRHCGARASGIAPLRSPCRLVQVVT